MDAGREAIITGPSAISGTIARQIATSDEPSITAGFFAMMSLASWTADLRVGLVVVEDEMNRTALDAARSVDRFFRELQRLLLAFAEKGARRSGRG